MNTINSILYLRTLKYDEINLTNFVGVISFIVSAGTLIYMVKSAFGQQSELEECMKELKLELKLRVDNCQKYIHKKERSV